MNGSDAAEKRYLFICGLHRSGTSALVDLLNGHSQIQMFQERFYNLVTDERIDEFTPRLFDAEHVFHPTSDETHFFEWSLDLDYAASARAKYENAVLTGDKVPHLFHFTDQIFQRFANARMVFLTRNVFDVANSWQKRFEDPEDEVWVSDHAEAVRFWNDAHRIILPKLKEHPERLKVVSYERLYSFSPNYFRALLRFAGVDDADQTAHVMYRRMTDGWMQRFSAPRVLDDAQFEFVQNHAETALQRAVVAGAEID